MALALVKMGKAVTYREPAMLTNCMPIVAPV
jgi:hypothetical protein